MQFEFKFDPVDCILYIKKSLIIKPRRVSQILLQATQQLTEIKETHYDFATYGYRINMTQIKIEIRYWRCGCETMACLIAPPSV